MGKGAELERNKKIRLASDFPKSKAKCQKKCEYYAYERFLRDG